MNSPAPSQMPTLAPHRPDRAGIPGRRRSPRHPTQVDGRSRRARRFRDLCRLMTERHPNVSADLVRHCAGLTLQRELLEETLVNGGAMSPRDLISLSGAIHRAERRMTLASIEADRRAEVEQVRRENREAGIIG